MLETILALAVKNIIITQFFAGAFTGLGLGMILENRVRKTIRKRIGGQ